MVHVHHHSWAKVTAGTGAAAVIGELGKIGVVDLLDHLALVGVGRGQLHTLAREHLVKVARVRLRRDLRLEGRWDLKAEQRTALERSVNISAGTGRYPQYSSLNISAGVRTTQQGGGAPPHYSTLLCWR